MALMGMALGAVTLGLFLGAPLVALLCSPGLILFIYFMARAIALDIKEWREIRCSRDY